MEILYLIMSLCIILILIVSNARVEAKYKLSSKLSTATFLGGCVTSILLSLFFDSLSPKPQAIDVYRGNTKLKIDGFYQDSTFIPTDSIVILKK